MNSNAVKALGKNEYAALDLIDALPDKTARVRSRANAANGTISKVVADRLVAAGKVQFNDHGDSVHITTAAPVAVPDAVTVEDVWEAQDKVAATKKKTNAKTTAAAKSPYSTAPVAGLQKRHGKSRRTGTETQILDLLHPKAPHPLKGTGRYWVECMTHNTHQSVPDMSTAKPLQARTDQFCTKCATEVKNRATDAA